MCYRSIHESVEENSIGHAIMDTTTGTKSRTNRMKRIRKKRSKVIMKISHVDGSNAEKQDSGIVYTPKGSFEGVLSSHSSCMQYAFSNGISVKENHDSMPAQSCLSPKYVLPCADIVKGDEIHTGESAHTLTRDIHPSLDREEVHVSAQSKEIPSKSFNYGVISVGSDIKSFVHGNYHRYYGYRLKPDHGEDHRISLLEKHWFHKKRCLDIGCNEGVLTLDMVVKFGTASMTGIDLDEYLIKRACSHLREQRSTAINEFVLSQKAQVDPKTRKQVKRRMQSLAQTWFVHGNVLASNVEHGSFECITAFSVIKWIHLHGGDGAVRYLFSKIYDLLAPGGRFILEPQPWKSYKAAAQKMKKNKMNTSLKDTYFFRLHDLKLRPENFCSILPEEFGLTFIRELCPPSQTATGFDRKIYMFQKLH